MNRKARRLHAANQRMRLALMNQRSCGQCRECCTSLPVELENGVKPAGAVCEHLRALPEKGCAVYEDRPHGCRIWRCVWLAEPNTLTGDERPDRLGVVFDCRPTALDMTVILARESWPGAWRTGPVQAAVRRLAENNVVMLVSGDSEHGTFVEHERVGPKMLLDRWTERVVSWEEKQREEVSA